MFEKKYPYIVTTVIGALGLLLYASINSMTEFIGFMTFTALPYILGVFAVVSVIFDLIFTLHKPNKIGIIISFCYNVVIFVFSLGFIIACRGNIKDFLMQGLYALLIYIVVALLIFIIFYLPKLQFKGKKIVAIVLCVVLSAGVVIGFTDLKNLRINYITEGAVVWAVEDDYQIVWTTEVKGSGWVEISGVKYYDEIAGSIITEQRVHKVTVPQSVLDTAKSYTVNSRKMIAEKGFYATQGKVVSKTYLFRPVDESDGLQYYTVADTHDHNGVAAKAAKYWGERTDFVILCGDMVSFLENDVDLRRILNLAYKMTGGNIPAVFAKGNHENKSEKAEQLYRYVGSNDGDFYFTFRLGSVWGLVLDMGEDHADDWYEFYGTAQFDAYRQEQLSFLNDVITNKDSEYNADGVTHRIAICHIPTAFTSYSGDYMYQTLIDINERLNLINLDAMYSGHLHNLFITEKDYDVGEPLYILNIDKQGDPNYLATGAGYYNIICSKSSRTQLGKSKLGWQFSGVASEYDGSDLTIMFTNDKKEAVSTVSYFEDKDYGKAPILK